MVKALIILAALIIGIVAGVAIGDGVIVTAADVIGTLWLNGLRMTVIPLVVALLITGIAQTAEAARAGRLAGRAVITMIVLLWCSATFAAFALPAMLAAFPMPEAAAASLKAAVDSVSDPQAVPPFADFLRAIVPTNPIAAASNDAVLPLIVFTMTFAFAILALPADKRTVLTAFFDATASALLIIINWVLMLAPIGVGALALVIGAKAGSAAFGALAHYVITLSSLGLMIWVAAFVVAMVGARLPIGAFFRASLPAQAVAISTQSSLASLPAMVRGVTALGIPPARADVILPIAVAIFRVTGPAMNLGVAIYVAHWFGITLTPMMLFIGVVVAATTTLGAVSLPGSVSFITSCAPICVAMGLPIEPLGLLIAIETFPDIFRTLGNVTMDMAVTGTVARGHDRETAPSPTEPIGSPR